MISRYMVPKQGSEKEPNAEAGYISEMLYNSTVKIWKELVTEYASKIIWIQRNSE